MTTTRLTIFAAAVAADVGTCTACGASTPHAGGSTAVTTTGVTTASPPTSSATTVHAAASTSAASTTTGSTGKSTTTGVGAGALPDPCSLVSLADAAAVLGGAASPSLGDPIANPTDPAAVHNACTFSNPGQANALLVVALRGPVTAAEFATAQPQMNGTALAGVGDAAFVDQPDALVAFLKGSVRDFLERSNPLKGQAQVDQVVAIARTVAAKL